MCVFLSGSPALNKKAKILSDPMSCTTVADLSSEAAKAILIMTTAFVYKKVL